MDSFLTLLWQSHEVEQKTLAQPIKDNLCSFLATSSGGGQALPPLASGRWRAEEGDLRSRWCLGTWSDWDLGPFINRQSCDREVERGQVQQGMLSALPSVTVTAACQGSQLLPPSFPT